MKPRRRIQQQGHFHTINYSQIVVDLHRSDIRRLHRIALLNNVNLQDLIAGSLKKLISNCIEQDNLKMIAKKERKGND